MSRDESNTCFDKKRAAPELSGASQSMTSFSVMLIFDFSVAILIKIRAPKLAYSA